MRWKELAMVVLLLATILVPGYLWFDGLNDIRNTYANELIKKGAKADWARAVDFMQKQSELLLNWAIALLGGIVAIITTRTLHQFKYIKLLYLLLAPALSLLVGSIWAAQLFQRRLTYLKLHDRTGSGGGTLNDLLLAQSEYLQYAIWILAFFSVICLIQIVAGCLMFEHRRAGEGE
jgi:hypothetical protein